MFENITFDALIWKAAEKYRLPFYLIRAQIWAESDFCPKAISTCGAKGLMQLMPGTARDMGAVGVELFDPEINIDLGVKYDRWLFDHFPEIADREERLKFTLAAYNCGRGYVNKALKLAREEEFGFEPLATIRGRWQTWKFACRHLASPLCFIEKQTGARVHPDFSQVWRYVDKIWEKYQEYTKKGGG